MFMKRSDFFSTASSSISFSDDGEKFVAVKWIFLDVSNTDFVLIKLILVEHVVF